MAILLNLFVYCGSLKAISHKLIRTGTFKKINPIYYARIILFLNFEIQHFIYEGKNN